ncbi:MAG: hypothetical protein GY757_25435 [bacterium]|nr:hypothetical protein [bacterium]
MYKQLRYDDMSSGLETSDAIKSSGIPNIADNYVKEDGSLDIETVIRKFQE